MKPIFKLVAILALITVGGTAAWIQFTKEHVLVLDDGTVYTVDNIWESGESIIYEIDDELFVVARDKVQSYGERGFNDSIPGLDSAPEDGSESYASEDDGLGSKINGFLKSNNVSGKLSSTQYIYLLGLLLFLLTLLVAGRLPKKKTAPVAQKTDDQPPAEIIEEVSPRNQIVSFFLSIFKHQIDAPLSAAVEYQKLDIKSGGPNEIYELRVRKGADWTKRRMTIGPLGEDSGSKSQCFYVIYDVHMVIKIPAKPITDFEHYIISIEKEAHIVNKLIPKECIVPKVSVVMGMIHSIPTNDSLTADQLEKKYIEWLRHSPDYQEYLKINSTFVYVMDLSKYYFLGHILDELHDIKDLITREISENAAIIWDATKFRGRYGTDNDALFEVRDLYNACAADIRQLADTSGITTTVSDYQIQSWFTSHLTGTEASSNAGGYPERFIEAVNDLIAEAVHDNSGTIEVYRRMVGEHVYMSSFEQNRVQMGAISTNLLDILAWFQQKRVAMRDLKPDNLFVAGDNQKYPLFLRSASDFSLGIIDVETAVDFEKSKYLKIAQPLLGGTPFYATPSHFLKNNVIADSFGNLGTILHLQDWHAIMVMIYKVITGELLFDQTAKLFTSLRNIMVQANNTEENRRDDIVAETSRMFWHSAAAEFKVKTDAAAPLLKAVVLIFPDLVQEMFARILEKERKSVAAAIKECVQTQRIFEKDQVRAVLLNASHAKTCQFRTDLENKARKSGRSAESRKEAIIFLNKLIDLKARFGQHHHMQKLLARREAQVCAYDVLTFMFNVVLNNMYKSHWPPLFGETVVAWDQPVQETVFEESPY